MPLLSRDELEQIPPRYRLLIKMMMKFPNPGFPFFVLKHFPELAGIFWTIVVPIFLVLYFFFSMWLFPFVTSWFGFPLNYVFGLLIPAVILVFSLRIQLERAILWWKHIHEEPREWLTSEKVEELIGLLKKQQKGKKS